MTSERAEKTEKYEDKKANEIKHSKIFFQVYNRT